MPKHKLSMHRAAALLGVLCTSAGCTPKAPSANASASVQVSAPVWWSPDLNVADLASIPPELKRPLEDPLDMVKGGVSKSELMASCADYLRLRPQQYEASDPTGFGSMLNTGARCQTLIALQRAKPSTDNRLSNLLAERDLLNKMPAALGVAQSPDELETRASATRSGQRWSAYDGAVHVAEQCATKVVVQSADMTSKLELLARGDFNGDGTQDLLIKSLSYGSEGSWFDMRLVLIGAQGNASQLEVLEELPL